MENDTQAQAQAHAAAAAADPSVKCAAWIRRPENAHLVVVARSSSSSTTTKHDSVIEIFSYDSLSSSLSSSPEAQFLLPSRGGAAAADPSSIAVHPNGDEFICFSTDGHAQWFELYVAESANVTKLVLKQGTPLEGIGLQKCASFSVDGSMLATGGADGHLRVFEWPSLRLILDEPKAHKSFRDLDFSLDSEFLASTSTDGSARVWNMKDALPLVNLARNADEKFELCRFSKDGTKPFLFCTVQKGSRALTTVWDMSTWTKIGYKRLLRKSASVMSISLDGKYLALGSKDGDFCVVDVKQMEISHWSRSLHPGTRIASLEFCPSERVMLSTSGEWGAVVTKLNVPADWKVWQIYMVLLGLFLASAVAFYIFFQNSDHFWNFPIGRDQPARPKIEPILKDPQAVEDRWGAFGPLDL